jgi:hypothetical protein
MAAFTVQMQAAASARAAAPRSAPRCAALRCAAPAAASPRASPLSARAAAAGAPLRATASTRRAPRSRGPAPTRAVLISETVVDIDTPTGKMRTYVLKPTAPGKYPGIVLYSEIFQASSLGGGSTAQKAQKAQVGVWALPSPTAWPAAPRRLRLARLPSRPRPAPRACATLTRLRTPFPIPHTR